MGEQAADVLSTASDIRAVALTRFGQLPNLVKKMTQKSRPITSASSHPHLSHPHGNLKLSIINKEPLSGVQQCVLAHFMTTLSTGTLAR